MENRPRRRRRLCRRRRRRVYAPARSNVHEHSISPREKSLIPTSQCPFTLRLAYAIASAMQVSP